MWRLVAPLWLASLACAQQIQFATYLGGGGGETIRSVTVDSRGNVYVTGRTDSPDFPVKNAAQAVSRAFSQSFAAKFSPEGELLYSTYLGGSANDAGMAIAVDAAGYAVITGSAHSTDFPVTANAAQPDNRGGVEAIVYRLNPDGKLEWATYLGGSANDMGEAIAVDPEGNVYVGGRTESTDFPVTEGARPVPRQRFGFAGFIAKLTRSGAVVYSTALGGDESTVVNGIAVGADGQAVVAGETSAMNFPTTESAPQTTPGRTSRTGVITPDAFVARLSADGSSLVYSTYWGAAGSDAAKSVVLNEAGDAYVTGVTTSGRLPVTAGEQETLGGRVYLHSDDGGLQWIGGGAGLRTSMVVRLAVSPHDTQTLFAATWDGLYRSLDNGATWEASGLDGLTVSELAFDPNNSQVLYAGTGYRGSGRKAGLFRSEDGGQNWISMTEGFQNPLYPGLAPATFSIDAIAVGPGDIYAVTGSGGFGFGYDQPVFRVTEGGAVWTGIGKGLPTTPSSMVIAPDGTLLVGSYTVTSRTSVFSGCVCRRTGESWTATVSDDIRAMAVAGGRVYAAGRQLHVSTDSGIRWSAYPRPAGELTQLVADPRQPFRLVAVIANQAWQSTDGGETWRAWEGGPYTAALVAPDGRVHAGTSVPSDAFVMVLDPQGGLLRSSYVGGASAEVGEAIGVDPEGGIVIAGFAPAGRPYSGSAYLDWVGRPERRIVLGGSTSATMLGVPGRGVAVDRDGNVIAVMIATQSGLPVTANAVQKDRKGDSDVYLVKFMPSR